MYAFTSIALTALILPMTPFEAEQDGKKIGLARADIPTLFLGGVRNAAGEIELPVRYQIRHYRESKHRIAFDFREPGRTFPSEPITTWTSPPFDLGDSTHVNAVKFFRVPCQPGKYRITLRVERFIEGIDRNSGPFARWNTIIGDTYTMTIRERLDGAT